LESHSLSLVGSYPGREPSLQSYPAGRPSSSGAPGLFPVMKLQFDAEKMSIKDRDNHIIKKLSEMEKKGTF